jgi:hypothetical protein
MPTRKTPTLKLKLAKPSPRRRLPKRNKTLLPHKRTIDTIERALARTSTMARSGMSDYMHCRMDPFASSGKGSIPDGGNNSYVVVDNRSFDTIVIPDTSTYIIQTLPTLPASAMLFGPTASAGCTVNGVPITFSATSNLSTNIGSGTPLSVLPQWLAGGGYLPGISINDPYMAATARLVSCGYKLTYTGPVLTAAGSITVTPNDVALSVLEPTTSGVSLISPGQTNLTIKNNSNVLAQVATIGTLLLQLDGTTNSAALTRDTIVLRPEQGVYIVPKHKSNVFKNIPVSDTASGLVANPTTDSTLGLAYTNLFTLNNTTVADSTYDGGIIWYDNDWSTTQITIAGMGVGASFRWDTIWCMELNPSISSVIAPLTIKASPNVPSEVVAAQTATNKRPNATSGRPVIDMIPTGTPLPDTGMDEGTYQPSTFTFNAGNKIETFIGDKPNFNSLSTFKLEDGYLTFTLKDGSIQSYERRRD